MNINEIEDLRRKKGKILFVGIGGISMSSVALFAIRAGFAVKGSDRCENAMTEMLRKKGIDVVIGHKKETAEDCDVLVYTAAVGSSTPELERAHERGIPCYSRAQFLGYIMQGYKTRIGVSGTHGKTTTTSMISEIFLNAGLDPTICNGAVLPSIGGAYKLGGNEFFIYEACEYKDSFLSFFPTIAVISNVELDHTDYFPNIEAMIRSFEKSLENAQVAIVNADSENAMKAARSFDGMLITFSLRDEYATYHAKNVSNNAHGSSFTFCKEGIELYDIHMGVSGEFNIYNALSAAACADLCGIEPQSVKDALLSYRGAKRRFEIKYRTGGVTIVDDYAHHPTEIKATLSSSLQLGYKKVYCIYQPHTYSRTYALFDDFVSALSIADETILVDIYPAREENVYGVSSAALADKIKGGVYLDSLDKIADYAAEKACPEDLFIVMGAGDANVLCEMINERLVKKFS